MKLRTEEQVHDFLASDIIWRKKELSQFKFLLGSSISRADRRDALLRGTVTILYAHWEGFIKSASQAYLNFLSCQRLRLEELSPNFLALASRNLLQKASASSKIHAHIELTRLFREGLSSQSIIPYDKAISTQANLSSKVLFEIIETLGLDASPFATKEHLIDEGLLEARNTIAHGEYLILNVERYEELHREVVLMMEDFRSQVDNAVASKKYRID